MRGLAWAAWMGACVWGIKLGKANLWAASLLLALVTGESLSPLSHILNSLRHFHPWIGGTQPVGEGGMYRKACCTVVTLPPIEKSCHGLSCGEMLHNVWPDR